MVHCSEKTTELKIYFTRLINAAKLSNLLHIHCLLYIHKINQSNREGQFILTKSDKHLQVFYGWSRNCEGRIKVGSRKVRITLMLIFFIFSLAVIHFWQVVDGRNSRLFFLTNCILGESSTTMPSTKRDFYFPLDRARNNILVCRRLVCSQHFAMLLLQFFLVNRALA